MGEEVAGLDGGGGAGEGGCVGEDVVGTGGGVGVHAGVCECGDDAGAFGFVVGGEGGVEVGAELFETVGCAVLEGGGGADVGEVVEVGDCAEPLGVCNEVAETPAGDGEGFGEAGDDDGAFAEVGEAEGGDVLSAGVEEVLVDFVGEEEEVVTDGEVADGFDLGVGEDFAGGVGGGVDEDGAGAGGDGALEGVIVEGPVGGGGGGGVEGDGDGLDAEGAEGGEVVAVEGLKEDDFVAGVEQSHDGGVESAGSPGGDEDFAVRVGGDSLEVLDFGGDAGTEAGNAVEAGVDVVTGVDGVLGTVEDGGGGLGVADSLGEIDAAEAVALHGHGADFRLEGAGGEFREGEGGGCGGHGCGCPRGRWFQIQVYHKVRGAGVSRW